MIIINHIFEENRQSTLEKKKTDPHQCWTNWGCCWGVWFWANWSQISTLQNPSWFHGCYSTSERALTWRRRHTLPIMPHSLIATPSSSTTMQLFQNFIITAESEPVNCSLTVNGLWNTSIPILKLINSFLTFFKRTSCCRQVHFSEYKWRPTPV